MGKKKQKQKKKNLLKLITELLIGAGTFLAGLASLIQVLKQ